ncbi:enterotoxin A family protein [Xenorhabdus thuongxuanensis]|uniref:Pertussis toxin subunit 1 n=1 Tax=Xenorhabdus thuongxuanensis TaxID=1873484 RepID=A0A1Q5TKF9_9GAMM|nr:enterotoxin A family protein [Xenorhabdus thuongxuanensis]OKP00713.1 pertussis toxin subunit 1 precursor [Xenorhabdus thuongxuanensis]
MRILKLFYLLCALFLYIAQSYAQPPIDRVYRMDFRPLERIIIDGGFLPLGTNDDIVQHVQGVDLEGSIGGNSAFVSTSTDREFAFEWGADFNEAHEPFYIYDIRPTPNFYSVLLSLEYLYQQTDDSRYQNLINTFGHQAEYVALGGISIEQVYGMQEYVYDQGAGDYVERGGYIPNTLYRGVQTGPNAGPYIQHSQPQNEIITSVSYCALNLSLPRYSVRLTASTHDKYPFLKKLKICHDSLSTITFLNVTIL